ncbi:MAG: DUF72 domain-containing protein [Betaproteobacteria bacterium]|nr:DUF72 domain-containing protein [Betaproteobacteria bacterium]
MSRTDYFAHFSLVEIQQTFYQPPRTQTLERWRLEAPPHFEFAIKAWQLITHDAGSPTYRRLKRRVAEDKKPHYGSFRLTREVMDAWGATVEAARALAACAIVFQCPGTFTPTPAHLDQMRRFFMATRAEAPELIRVWEPRGPWPRELIGSLCEELGLLYSVDPFKTEPLPGKGQYFRLHGLTDHTYRHSDADLARLFSRCRGRSYCLFNNMFMAEDAQRFLNLVRTSGRAPP